MAISVRRRARRTVPAPPRLGKILQVLALFPHETLRGYLVWLALLRAKEKVLQGGDISEVLDNGMVRLGPPGEDGVLGEDAFAFKPPLPTDEKIPKKSLTKLKRMARGMSRNEWEDYVFDLTVWQVSLKWLASLSGSSIRTAGPGDSKMQHFPKLGKLPYKASIDAEGKARFTLHESIEVLEGVEASRIRICAHCQDLFWARRIDKVTCSARCGNNWRNRKWNERYKDPSPNSGAVSYLHQRFKRDDEQRARRPL